MKKLTAIFVLTLSLSVEAKLHQWQHPDVQSAWQQGYKGQNTEVVIIDDFSSSDKCWGILEHKRKHQQHGLWVSDFARIVAPEASISRIDYTIDNNLPSQLKDPNSTKLTIINLSFGVTNDYTKSPSFDIRNADLLLSNEENSLVEYAKNGEAIVVKAAGNDTISTSYPLNRSNNTFDILDYGLRDGQSILFVGALNKNGTPTDQAQLTSYSNYAGNNANIQNHFVSVGVEDDITELSGTSFAAPIVSGYAAIIGSKFVNATPNQVVKQILDTARTDTIVNYSKDIHGCGEASLSRSLAPTEIK